jgi:hypothetical protein
MGNDIALVCMRLIEMLRSLIISVDFMERHRRSKKDFTRQRCLTFFRRCHLPAQSGQTSAAR